MDPSTDSTDSTARTARTDRTARTTDAPTAALPGPLSPDGPVASPVPVGRVESPAPDGPVASPVPVGRVESPAPDGPAVAAGGPDVSAAGREPAGPLPPLPATPLPPLPPAPSATDPGAGRTGGFTLRRSRTDRMLGGVCGGLAAHLGVDAALLRIGLVVLTVFGFGLGAVVYLAAWILAPEEDA